MNKFLRHRVSQNRRRLVSGKYDLDLTYICHNIIAMGYPSDNALQGLIRNQIGTVSKYLKEKHDESFKIFNLCIESDYDFTHFENKVECFPMEDHNPPKFPQIDQFCKTIQSWLDSDSNNVAAVHCKAGKGRTGTMISCYFLYSKKSNTPFEAMDSFSTIRCKDSKGVTIPSQRRYIEYYADFLQNKREYDNVGISLVSIEINVPKKLAGEFPRTLKLQIYKDSITKIYESKKCKIDNDLNKFLFQFDSNLVLNDDIKFCFHKKDKSLILKVIFNTFCFMQNNIYAFDEQSCQGKKIFKDGKIYWEVKKKDIDLAYKDKLINDDLSVVFCFEAPKIEYNKLESITEEIESVGKIVENKSKTETLNKKDDMLIFKNEFFLTRQTEIDKLNLDILKLFPRKSNKFTRSVSWPNENENLDAKNESNLIKKDNTQIDLNNLNNDDNTFENNSDLLNKRKKTANSIRRLFRRKPLVSIENLKSK